MAEQTIDPKTFEEVNIPDLTDSMREQSYKAAKILGETNLKHLSENLFFRCNVCEQIKPICEWNIDNGHIRRELEKEPDGSMRCTLFYHKILHCKECAPIVKDLLYGVPLGEDAEAIE